MGFLRDQPWMPISSFCIHVEPVSQEYILFHFYADDIALSTTKQSGMRVWKWFTLNFFRRSFSFLGSMLKTISQFVR